jgi:hypothetical protein
LILLNCFCPKILNLVKAFRKEWWSPCFLIQTKSIICPGFSVLFPVRLRIFPIIRLSMGSIGPMPAIFQTGGLFNHLIY